MNPNDPRHPWRRLAAAARQAKDERGEDAPYGFATRLAALAWAQERRVASLFDRFALRALGIACLLALLSLAVNYPALREGSAALSVDEDSLVADDGLAIVLEHAAD